MPDLPRPLDAAVEGKLQHSILLAWDEDQERDGGGIAAGHGEVHAVRLDSRPPTATGAPEDFHAAGRTSGPSRLIHASHASSAEAARYEACWGAPFPGCRSYNSVILRSRERCQAPSISGWKRQDQLPSARQG